MASTQWTNYWSQGNITSLPLDFNGNYDAEIKAFWNEQFKPLESGATVLDVCSGNGAIALLAAEYALENSIDLKIIATDAAKIDREAIKAAAPTLEKAIELIQFIDDTPLEQLQLDDGSVDLITSQYGVEYTDWSVVAELFERWLKPGGHIAMISHSVDSAIIEKMNAEKKEYDIVESTGFFGRARQVLKHNPTQKELQGLLEPVGQELYRSLLTQFSPVLKPLMQTAQFVFKASPEQFRDQKKQIIHFLSSLVDAKLRLNDLLTVHKRFNDHPEWFKTFEFNGVSLVSAGKVVYQGKHPAGETYVLGKSAGQ
ncbi:class I SAM-dependent methyltransferase [Pleionea litopenaei]|uniref:Class I SAM-dependent methyltransferase n=1 Tax=Pleionea litopenaei TaxID=3070815 RepID=A0AA51RS13_9GAMM|nr:class I SAM-dependent methyltransferase [Pleionea sp. HL-JVS1]WMS86536.1 class I SAM-dependent methyltransferase [Pleionea sp. HL-JVS1]